MSKSYEPDYHLIAVIMINILVPFLSDSKEMTEEIKGERKREREGVGVESCD